MKITTVIAACSIFCAVVATPASAQSASHRDTTLDSQRRAAEVLRRGISVHGGLERLRGFETVQLNARLSNSGLGQGLRPGASGAATSPPGSFNQVRDLRTGRRMFEILTSDTASQPVQRVDYSADVIRIHNLVAGTVGEVDRGTVDTFLRQFAYVPEILLQALDRVGTTRWIGEEREDGGVRNVITYAAPDGKQHSLSFDSRTGRLVKSSLIATHAQFGDHVSDARYLDYTSVSGVSLPRRIESRVAGRASAVVDFVEMAFDVPFDTSLLDFPEDATPAPPLGVTTVRAEDLEATELGDGVYVIPNTSGAYNTMFVALDDHVLVLEAPISPQISRAVMEKIHRVEPGKPIRYTAISHYHFDHSGGLRAYLDEGVTILTTPGNEQFVRDVAGASRTLDGDWGHTPSARIESVEGRKVHGSGSRRVEFYDVGPNPHVDEILIAYLPSLKLMFVADIYGFNGTVSPANAQTLSLAEKLEELGLDIEIVVPVHGQRTTGENFWEAVRLGRAGS